MMMKMQAAFRNKNSLSIKLMASSIQRVSINVKEKVDVHFAIKYLVSFTKATSLSSRVRISLCDKVPVVVEYNIEDNGFLRFYLAPKIDDNDNKDKEMDDD